MDLPEEKARIVRAVVKEIEKVPDAVARGEYLRQASERLGVDEATLRRHRRDHGGPDKGPEEGTSLSPAEKRLLQILFENKDDRPRPLRRGPGGGFPGPAERARLPLHQELLPERRDWNFPGPEGHRRRPGPGLACPGPCRSGPAKPPPRKPRNACGRSGRSPSRTGSRRSSRDRPSREKAARREKLLALLYQKQDITKQILAL